MKILAFPKRILIVNTFGIGDVLFTTPLIRNLKEVSSDIYIGYIANKRTAPILERNSNINKVFVYERDDFNEAYKRSKGEFIKRVFTLLNEVKEEHFDMIIDLSLNSYTSFFMWLIGIKQRIGFNYKNRSPFLNKKIKLRGYESKHVVQYYLEILEQLGVPIHHQDLEITVSPEDEQWAKKVLAKNNIAFYENIVGLIPGGGASWGTQAKLKRWGKEAYAKLADKIIEKFSAKVILMGDKSEEDLCHQVARLMKEKPINLCGETSIAQLAALQAKCKVVLLNDGGPLHVGVAAGAKTISIFGPVDENVYGPYPHKGHWVVTKELPCRPCYRRFRMASCEHMSCLNTITVEDVLRKVEQVL